LDLRDSGLAADKVRESILSNIDICSRTFANLLKRYDVPCRSSQSHLRRY